MSFTPPQQYHQQPLQQVQQDVVSGEQYRYALTNFRIAHEKVESQRLQLEEQERQVALLRERISLLEGGSTNVRQGRNGNTVDDFSIKNAASQLDKLVNRWAADIARAPPVPLAAINAAVLADAVNGQEVPQMEANSMLAQCYLRHAMAETISEGIINCLVVTNSTEANVQLTRMHEHIFTRDPTVACVWRRQTFSAAIETVTPELSLTILHDNIPELTTLFNHTIPISGNTPILQSAFEFARMLHGSNTTSGDAFYRAFVPELGSTLYPQQVELVKRCLRSERGDYDNVGATIFPGLVKVTRGAVTADGRAPENIHTVVRRALVICECALNRSAATPAPMAMPPMPGPQGINEMIEELEYV